MHSGSRADCASTIGATHAEACSVVDELSAISAKGVPASRVLLVLDQHMDYAEGTKCPLMVHMLTSSPL